MYIPALTDNKRLRFTTATAMYFAQGIQMGLMLVAMPAFLAANGLEASSVGVFIGTIMLPWSLKIFNAPIMDRFSFLPMGRRRPWVILGLLGGSIGYLLMGLVEDPLENIASLTSAALVVSFSTAFMDVAIDGMSIDIFSKEEQGSANAYMWGGKVIGSSLTAAGAAFLMNNYGMPTTFFAASAFTFLFMLFPLLLRERSGERLLPWTKGQASVEALQLQLKGWMEIGKNLFKVILLPGSLLLVIISFLHGITYGLFDALMPVFTVQELNWDDTSFSNLAALSGLVAGIFGMLAGGRLMAKFGKEGGVKISMMFLGITGILMGLLISYWQYKLTIDVFVMLIYICRTMILISIFAVAMALCWKSIAATQFALYMAIGNFGISIGAALLGPLSSNLSFSQVYYVYGALAFLAVIIIHLGKLRLYIHQTEEEGT